MPSYDLIKDLPLKIESYELEGLEHEAPGFTRLSTVIHLKGGGEEGVGEDVVYDALDHVAQQDRGPTLELAGEHTIDSFSKLVERAELFPTPPEREVSVNYRRWAYESAALDLALRQAGVPLAQALGRTPSPVRFVVSTRLDEPPTADKVTRWLAHDPSLRFKLDPTDDWSDELMAELAALGVVDTLDMKGQYDDVPFGVPSDPGTYGRILAAFPDALIEDPRLTPELRATLVGHEDRVTWDAPLHSVDDILALQWAPRTVNMKPSRFGPLSRLFAAYDHLRDEGIAAYSGGQTELGPGRGQVQYLAALFHADAPNDIAPGGYNDPDPPDGLPGPPLPVAAAPTGFRWG